MNYGIENGVCRKPTRVIMHLPEAWTQIPFIRTHRLGLAGGAFIGKFRPPRSRIFALHWIHISSAAPVPDLWWENSAERYARRFEDLVITELFAEEVSKFSNNEAGD